MSPTGTLFFQLEGQDRVPPEAAAEDKFQIAPGATVEFDAAKDQMTIKRPQG